MAIWYNRRRCEGEHSPLSAFTVARQGVSLLARRSISLLSPFLPETEDYRIHFTRARLNHRSRLFPYYPTIPLLAGDKPRMGVAPVSIWSPVTVADLYIPQYFTGEEFKPEVVPIDEFTFSLCCQWGRIVF